MIPPDDRRACASLNKLIAEKARDLAAAEMELERTRVAHAEMEKLASPDGARILAYLKLVGRDGPSATKRGFLDLTRELVRAVNKSEQVRLLRQGLSPFKADWRIDAAIVGLKMAEADQLLKAVRDEVEESKKTLQSLSNEVSAVYDSVAPALLQQAQALRSARMTIVGELHDSLTVLRDVRRFFLESDYATEMERLERFIRVCKEIQALQQAGVFEAVCESALRLAVKEGK